MVLQPRLKGRSRFKTNIINRITSSCHRIFRDIWQEKPVQSRITRVVSSLSGSTGYLSVFDQKTTSPRFLR